MSERHAARALALLATALLLAVIGEVLLARDDLSWGSSTASVRLSGGTVAAPCGTVSARLDVVDVPSPGVAGVIVDAVYDPATNTPLGCEENPQGCWDTVMCNPGYALNTVRVVALHPTGMAGECPLADISWNICGNPGQCTNVDVQVVSFVDPDGQPITPVDDQDALNCVQQAGAVGGVAELADASDSPGRNYVPLAALAAAALVALAVGAWYARRRRVR